MNTFLNAQREDVLKLDVAGFIKSWSSLLPPEDKKAVAENEDIGSFLLETFADGLKHNCDGWADDDFASMKPWGFDVNEVRVPYFMYQGSEDKMVPYGHGKWLASHIPKEHLTAHLEDGQGHISIFLGRVDGMLEELLTAAGRK